MAQQQDHPIFDDIRRGDLEAVRQHVLANAGVLEERAFLDQKTPLMQAISCDEPAIALWLLEHRGQHDVNTADGDGGNALHRASRDSPLEVVQALLAAGANPTALTGGGYTPLMFASANGHTDIVAFLLQLPAVKAGIAYATERGGNTALSLASRSGHQPIVQLLLDAGADPTVPAGPTSPLNSALRNNHHAIAALLRRTIAEAERARAEAAAAEAAVRRARNEKRRQKKKNGKALRRAVEGSDAGAEEEEEEKEKEKEEEEEEEEEEEQELAVAVVGLIAGETAAANAGAEETGAEAADEEQQTAMIPAEEEEEEEEEMLAAAIALSLSPDRPPPLEEYLEADAPYGLLCPISIALLDDPVVLAADSITYSRAAIEQHFAFCRQRGKSLSAPSTNVEITDATGTLLVPNVLVRGLVLEYKAAKERVWAEAERRWQEAERMVAK